MPVDLIRYDLLAQEALRGVVRRVIADAAKSGLPGDHHFWDLAVSDDAFEVRLSFKGIPERLVVPFDAIKAFFDPSVKFGVQFDSADARSEEAPEKPRDAAPSLPEPVSAQPA